jgi:RHS repeat-associated protein
VASVASSNANGVSVSYAYDALNRIATVVDNHSPGGQNTTTCSYDGANNLVTVTYPNGIESTLTYDGLNRLKALNSTNASYTYTVGQSGNRISAVESSGRTLNRIYDGISRLSNETISLDPHGKNGVANYGLDPVGNRLNQSSTIPGIITAATTFDANDHASSETFDNNGNALTSNGRTVAYDFQNRLKSMSNGVAALVYDGDGNRVAKTLNGVTTLYLVDDLNPTGYPQVVEEIVGSAVTRTYTYGARRISQNQLINNVWSPSFYGYDGFGSVRLLTDSTGAVIDTYDYDAWGNTVNATGTTPNEYLFRGEQFDTDLGLYFLRARYYDPVEGRFLTSDPQNGLITSPVTLHRYLYANADPINVSDPTGRAGQIAAPGRVGSEYAILLNVAINLIFLRQLAQTSPGIVCKWQETDDYLEIGLLKILLSIFPDLPLPPPQDLNVDLAGLSGRGGPPPGGANYPNCKMTKCAIRCDVKDFSGGFDKTIGKATFIGVGRNEKEACKDAEDAADNSLGNVGSLINGRWIRTPGLQKRHCTGPPPKGGVYYVWK